MYEYESEFIKLGYKYIAGLDEAGRGPMAGPLVVALVILPLNYTNELINDSKKLSSKKRELLYEVIIKDSLYYHIEVLSSEEVDTLNPYMASKIGMLRCLEKVKVSEACLTDCMPLDVNIPVQSIIKGDSKSLTIASASILAKVTRDRIMNEFHLKYPLYQFDKHKGYVTKKHLELLNTYGVCPIHRKSYKPVKNCLEGGK